MTHLTILTGASRGMGLAMARQLLAAGHDLLCLSRKPSEELAQHAARAGRHCEQWPQDLARAETAAARLATWLDGDELLVTTPEIDAALPGVGEGELGEELLQAATSSRNGTTHKGRRRIAILQN